MKLLLKDLKPGDEFEYVNTTRSYRKGKFVVLNSVGSYFEPVAREGSAFIFSFTTNEVCQHRGQLDVNLILKAKENNMENKMGHFEGWKFGVPVKVSGKNFLSPGLEDVQLVFEDENTFRIVGKSFSKTYAKGTFSYELIPYKYSAYSLRYPVCQNTERTAYCNSGLDKPQMLQMDSCKTDSIKRCPAATLNIDGKIIELSAETTAELKNKLGI